jgi:hypothetical protein
LRLEREVTGVRIFDAQSDGSRNVPNGGDRVTGDGVIDATPSSKR